MAGLHTSSIWLYESGRQAPGRRAMSSLAQILGVEVVVAAIREEQAMKQDLPHVGDIWSDGTEVREVDHVGDTHVGFASSKGIKDMVTLARWRRWQRTAKLTHRKDEKTDGALHRIGHRPGAFPEGAQER